MLGRFVMSIQNVALKLSASRSLSLLKYLMLNHKQNIPREVLMDVFWPDTEPETARNNLNVALHAVRRALRGVIDLPIIVYRDGAYSLAPEIQVWLDVEEFEQLVRAGQRLESRNQSAAVSEYESAISLYQGDFLQENPYEGWTVLTRESLRMAYLNTLDSLSRIYFSQERYAACIMACQRILERDRCREDAHCLLMRCYSRQGQDHMALRQYQACVVALQLDLDVSPAPATTRLFQQIRQHKPG
jgi:DNA-binding SARP family transcriptional activator